MWYEDSRNKNTDQITIKTNNDENAQQNDENNEQNQLSNNKDQTELSYEHTQHTQLSHSSDNSIEEENKKNIYRLGNSDTWACKECKIKGDRHFMKQHFCKGILKKQQQKATIS